MSLEHSPAGAGDVAPDRIIGERECRKITDLSRTSRWRMMRRQEFPAKVRISPNRTGWRLSQILKWLRERETVV